MNVQEEGHYLVIGGLTIFISAFGVVGNIMTLILVKKNQTFRDVNQARLFLGNLAAVDLLNSILALVSGFGYINKDIIAGGHQVLCYFTGYARTLFPPIAVFSMTLLTVNRYYTTIKMEMAERLFRRKQSWTFIIFIWMALILLPLIVIATTSKTSPVFDTEKGLCAIQTTTAKYFQIINGSLSSVCLFAMLCMNLKIGLHIRKYNNRIRDENLINDLVHQERNRKITTIVSVIFVCYIICYAPVLIVNIFSLMGDSVKGTILPPLAFLFFNINYVNNVFIYGIMDKIYRKNCKELFCKCNAIMR